MNMTVPVELLAKDLNPQGGIFCPSPAADMKKLDSASHRFRLARA